jgi:hypothetical protein
MQDWTRKLKGGWYSPLGLAPPQLPLGMAVRMMHSWARWLQQGMQHLPQPE